VVRISGRPSFSFPVASPWPRDVHRSSPPPLAAGRRLRPSPPLLYPLNGFPVSPSTFPSKPRSKPRPATRYRVSRRSPAERRRSGRRRRAPPPPRLFPSRPHRRIGIRRPRTDLTASQSDRVPVNRAVFANEPLCFSRINPRSVSVQKYLRFSPFSSV
jgi:hypothetical protein